MVVNLQKFFGPKKTKKSTLRIPLKPPKKHGVILRTQKHNPCDACRFKQTRNHWRVQPGILREWNIHPPETNITPKNGWLEYYCPLGFRPIFRCKLAVCSREGTSPSSLDGESSEVIFCDAKSWRILQWVGWTNISRFVLLLGGRYYASVINVKNWDLVI